MIALQWLSLIADGSVSTFLCILYIRFLMELKYLAFKVLA